jgi:mRNA interferase YafQ
MLKVEYTTQFKRDLKLARKRKKDMAALQQIMKKIEHEENLNPKLKDHPLTGNWKAHRELHVEPAGD